MHPLRLDHQCLIRDASGYAVDPAVDLAQEHLTRLDELGKRVVALRRVAVVGTRSAFATRTVASDATLDSGSAGTPATCSTVTVFSLSVNANAGTPPQARKVASRHDSSVPIRRSQVGTTTRNRDHANQAQNSIVGRGLPSGPNTIGPAPQSNCSHNPGSVIQGRYDLRCPSR